MNAATAPASSSCHHTLRTKLAVPITAPATPPPSTGWERYRAPMTRPCRLTGTPMYSLRPMVPVSIPPCSTRPTEGGTGSRPTSDRPPAPTTTTPLGSSAIASTRARDGRPEALNPRAATVWASTSSSRNSRSRSSWRKANPTARYIIRMVTATANTITEPSLARMLGSRSRGRRAISSPP
jgi:hypothetical protein